MGNACTGLFPRESIAFLGVSKLGVFSVLHISWRGGQTEKPGVRKPIRWGKKTLTVRCKGILFHLDGGFSKLRNKKYADPGSGATAFSAWFGRPGRGFGLRRCFTSSDPQNQNPPTAVSDTTGATTGAREFYYSWQFQGDSENITLKVNVLFLLYISKNGKEPKTKDEKE